MRTIVYVDGFNLFKGALTKTPYKWLDLLALCKHIIKTVHPESDVVQLKYFTAEVKGKYCKNPQSPQRQHAYTLALEKHLGVEVIKGSHSIVQVSGRLISHPEHELHSELVDIEKMEEKQTDVNIGIHIYRDCVNGLCDQVVLLSNDSDLKAPFEYLQCDFAGIQRGLILPNRARSSKTLSRLAHWTVKGIRTEDLHKYQLPRVISYLTPTGTRKSLKRPEGW